MMQRKARPSGSHPEGLAVRGASFREPLCRVVQRHTAWVRDRDGAHVDIPAREGRAAPGGGGGSVSSGANAAMLVDVTMYQRKIT
jgi:hypothetical protein